MIDMELQHRRARRFHSANFELTLARNAATAYKNDSGKLSSTQQKLTETPLTGKITFGLVVIAFIALVAIQLL